MWFSTVRYFNNVVDRAYEEPDPSISQSWVDQRILYYIETPSNVYNGLAAVIIVSILKNLTVFVIISGTFNRKQTPYHEKLKTIILTATGLLVEDAVSSFYQYFYFELYNDIEVWKRRTLMEKTIMTEVFQATKLSLAYTNLWFRTNQITKSELYGCR